MKSIELMGGPMDGEIMDVPNDAYHLLVPLPGRAFNFDRPWELESCYLVGRYRLKTNSLGAFWDNRWFWEPPWLRGSDGLV